MYQKAVNYTEAFLETHYTGFDEKIQRNISKGFSAKKLIRFFLFLIDNVNHYKIPIWNIKEIRYQFQWSYKKHILGTLEPNDMTEVVWKAQQNGLIRSYFRELVLSGYYYKRNRKKTWNIEWEPEGLMDIAENEELFAFHFRSSTIDQSWRIDQTDTIKTFLIKENGIFCS